MSSQEAAKKISVKLLQKSNSCISIDHLIPEIGITKINLLHGNTPIERTFFSMIMSWIFGCIKIAVFRK